MKNSSTTNILTIRLAIKSDIDAMLGLLKQLFELEADFHFNAAKQRNGLEQLLELSQSGKGSEAHAAVFVVTREEEIIAMCSCQVFISTAEGAKSGLVEDLVVDVEHRQQGIGQNLMQYVIQWAESQGIKRIQLLADKNNTPALDFYQSQGWQGTNLSAWFKFL